MIKTGKELATACVNVAKNFKTLYVMGCFGAPMTDDNKERYINHHSYNQKAARVKLINAATADTFGFDCVCLIKGLLWGWSGNKNMVYGGASCAINGVPDLGADQMFSLCKDISTDFSKIAVGEAVWLSGHIGVYIGDGLAVECTPAWDNCVQITAVHNIGKKSGYNGRKWTKHGKLPYVTYSATEEPVKDTAKVGAVSELPMLKKGSKGDAVKAVQILLDGYCYSLGKHGADADFGSDTENAVKAFQKDNNLEVDGKVGPETYAALLGIK